MEHKVGYIIGECSLLPREGYIAHFDTHMQRLSLEEKEDIEKETVILILDKFYTEFGLNVWLCSDVALLHLS